MNATRVRRSQPSPTANDHSSAVNARKTTNPATSGRGELRAASPLTTLR